MTTRTWDEWAVLFDWENGFEEYGEREDAARRYAEWFNARDQDDKCRVIRRTITMTVTDWEPA